MLQVLELVRQLNEDTVYEVEQINQRIARIVEERAKKLATSESELGCGVAGKQDADKLLDALEHEQHDQDNRLFISYSEIVLRKSALPEVPSIMTPFFRDQSLNLHFLRPANHCSSFSELFFAL